MGKVQVFRTFYIWGRSFYFVGGRGRRWGDNDSTDLIQDKDFIRLMLG